MQKLNSTLSAWVSILTLIFLILTSCNTQKGVVQSTEQMVPDQIGKDLSVLVVRGGHPYDTPGFENMCKALSGVNADLVLTAHMESMKVESIIEKYDAILFLNQNKKYSLEDRYRKQYMDLTEQGVGMVFLQFTLASHPEWDEFHNLVGGKYSLGKFEKNKEKRSKYFPGIEPEITILNTNHPVTKGLKNFSINDAYYGNIEIADGVTPLLGTNNPDLSETIAWAHHYNNSKVVYIMPGYTDGAYGNPNYRQLIENAISYVAGGK